jgi:hypothetical protein
LTVYSPPALHILANKAGWAWINDNAICLRCLESQKPETLRAIRHMQGVYFAKELTEDAEIKAR